MSIGWHPLKDRLTPFDKRQTQPKRKYKSFPTVFLMSESVKSGHSSSGLQTLKYLWEVAAWPQPAWHLRALEKP